MTALTLSPKAAIMYVVLGMAIGAGGGCRQLLALGRCLVALVAADAFMATGQLEVGATVVVEIPDLPVTCVMAGFALRAELEFVYVLLQVARDAGGIGILESRGQVALLAFHLVMLAQQRELGFVVVEPGGLFPRLGVVAILAALTLLAFVLVVLLVTGITRGLQLLFVQLALVAGVAFHALVLVQQRELGVFVMVEFARGLPVALDVASLALGAKITLVLVIGLVTFVA